MKLDLEVISLKEYEKIPMMYEDGELKRLVLDVGDRYIMREPEDFKERGDVVSVYEIVRLTETGNESKIVMLRIE